MICYRHFYLINKTLEQHIRLIKLILHHYLLVHYTFNNSLVKKTFNMFINLIFQMIMMHNINYYLLFLKKLVFIVKNIYK